MRYTAKERKKIYIQTAIHFAITYDFWVCSILLRYCPQYSLIQNEFPEFFQFEPKYYQQEDALSWWSGGQATNNRVLALCFAATLCDDKEFQKSIKH